MKADSEPVLRNRLSYAFSERRIENSELRTAIENSLGHKIGTGDLRTQNRTRNCLTHFYETAIVSLSPTQEENIARFLTLTEVAKMLHCSRNTARQVIATGELQAYRVATRIKVAPADLQSYLQSARETVAR